MRIRSIKPEFWKSDDTAGLADWHDRLVFIGLWSYVDDNGVGRDNERLITSELFGLDDPREASTRVRRALEHISDGGMITRYEASDGRRFLHVTNWHHQKIDRPSAPRYPLPTSENVLFDEGSTSTRRGLDDDSLRAPKDQGSGSKGSGSKGARDQTPPSPLRADVEALCEHLADRIEQNGSKRPPIAKTWRTEARLMLDNDGRTFDQSMKAIDWSQNSTFWRKNVMSMPTLREKFDQLRLAAIEEAEKSRNGHPVVNGNGYQPSTSELRAGQAMALSEEYRAQEEAAEHRAQTLEIDS